LALRKICLVTGVAGFIGSHLARRLLDEKCKVIGIDCFTDYYDPKIKEKNIQDLLQNPAFKMIHRDIVNIEDNYLLEEKVDWVFHQAAQAGVRASWGKDFEYYTHHNILGTQRMLEWACQNKPARFIYASSSSVYGETGKLPMHENDLPKPMSPYGVSKLAAEHLCNLYYQNFGVRSVSLRYFTVYGPGQRPDMAFNLFMRALRDNRDIIIYGTGEQTRDFTYVDDIVEANILAAKADVINGKVYNIGGGSRVSINGVLELLHTLSGRDVRVKYEPVQVGDPKHTYADCTSAREDLNFYPRTKLEEGLALMMDSIL